MQGRDKSRGWSGAVVAATLMDEQAQHVLRGMRSRMMGDYHVRFCEGLGGRFPWATRRFVLVAQSQIPLQMTAEHGGYV